MIVKKYIKDFCHAVSYLEDTLDLILLQLPPNLPYDLARLKAAILAFDNPQKLVVEFRNEKWYTKETKDLLSELGCIFCAADSPSTMLKSWVTAKTAYIRLHGRKRWFNYRYSDAELKEVAKFAKGMAKAGAKKIYILFNNDYYAYAVQNAQALNLLLNP